MYEKIEEKKNFNLLSSLVNQIINLYVSSAMLMMKIIHFLASSRKEEREEYEKKGEK